MDKEMNSLFRMIVLALLLRNTFFLGGIWLSVQITYGLYGNSFFCPFGSKAYGKHHPYPMQVLDTDKRPRIPLQR